MSAQKTKDNPVIYDKASRRIDIFCVIDRNAVLHVQSILATLKKSRTPENRDDNSGPTVVVNTCGGEALQGLAIYDLLRSSGFKIRTIILGEVASSGIAVALAGQERFMYRNGVLHFHQTAVEFERERSPKILRLEEIEGERRQIRIVDALFAKIILENSHISLRELKTLERHNAHVTAEQALKMGFVHRIIECF